MTGDGHHDPLERLEAAAERIVGRAEYEQANRRGLLWVHSLIGILGGVQMALWGTAINIELVTSPWARYPMGLAGFVGGAFVAYGLTRRPRSIKAELIGLATLGAWDAAMTIGLGTARWRQHDFDLIGFGKPLPEGYVAAYPVTIYAGLLALIGVHLWTLRNLHRAKHGVT